MEEPGRRIVKEEARGEGSALPWVDATAFARRAIALALADRITVAPAANWIFFDRGVIDAASALQHLTGEPMSAILGQTSSYNRNVFLAPPWPETYVTDPERRHDFDEAVSEYGRLLETYSSLGYSLTILPKVGVSERAAFVLQALGIT